MSGETKEMKETLALELEQLKAALFSGGSAELAGKADELAAKIRAGDVVFAFCGHFSAGKSSLINALCNAPLLPASPIPTSANIVVIRSGEKEEAVVTYRSGQTVSVPAEEVRRLAKDGTTVESVELRAPIPLIGERAVLIDTPGVDSTDEAHRKATEAALHLADVVFFVMDYNHVLSETNLEFAKQLSDSGKPLVLVVNQIDKHREEELSFDAFAGGVDQTFASWGVHPAACFYTSLQEPDHPRSEWNRLKMAVAALARAGDRIATAGIARAAVELAEEGAREHRARHKERRAKLERLAAQEDRKAAQRYEELQRLLAQRAGCRKAIAERLKAETASIADNAYLTPAATRELALKYLESRQPGFRAGFLFAAKRTEEERKKRLQAFQSELAEHVRTQLVFHVQDAVRKIGHELGLADAAVSFAQEAVAIDVSEERLASLVAPGAAATGEYTLNYAKEIAADIKTQARRAAQKAAERLADAAEALFARDDAQLREEAAALKEALKHRSELAALEQEEAEVREKLLAVLPLSRELARDGALQPVRAALAAASAAAAGKAQETAPVIDAAASAGPRNAPDLSRAAVSGADAPGASASGESAGAAERFAAAAGLIEQASRICEPHPALAANAAALRETAKRLRERRFTAALFGAFSAGKSSFANALIGEDVLPVSPNPTTAAINQIVPPTPDKPHGTAVIRMKTRKAALDDMRRALNALGAELPPQAEADELLNAARKALELGERPGAKVHLAFLKAAAEGFAEAEPLFGTEFSAGLEEFRAYAAEEKKSAFVDRIVLHFDSLLARAGVLLIDTPGADSVNARHTSAAFSFMKQADAVFYVTYYNHAFSRVDRQFLEQLGRVKDAFALDKMFFIVNAADLARNEEELEGVLNHVRDQLVSFGIRHPRLFPVSSLEASAARRAGDERRFIASGLAAFKASFSHFASRELSVLAFRTAQAELNRAASAAEQALQHARSGAAQREEALRRLGAEEAAAIAETASLDREALLRAAEKEAGEQLYYVKQRFFHRFGEWYAASFNPSVLRSDRGDMKQSLAFAWRDLASYLRTELAGEALAASLRLERFLEKLLAGAVSRINERLKRVFSAYEPPVWEAPSFRTPKIDDVWPGEAPDLKLLSASYRNAKAFFEGGGRDKLKEELERRWRPQITAAVDALAEHFKAWLAEELSRADELIREKLQAAVRMSADAARQAMSRPADPAEAERAWRELAGLREEFQTFSEGEIQEESGRETVRL